MFCKNCGKQIDENAVVCPHCGVAISSALADSGSFGWAVLGFFLPLVGLILYLVWRNTKPQSAKKAGIGALVGFVVNIVLSIVFSSAITAFMATQL